MSYRLNNPLPTTMNSGKIVKQNHRLRDLPTSSHGVLVLKRFASYRECGGGGGAGLGSSVLASATIKSAAGENPRGAFGTRESVGYRRLARLMIASWMSRYTLVLST